MASRSRAAGWLVLLPVLAAVPGYDLLTSPPSTTSPPASRPTTTAEPPDDPAVGALDPALLDAVRRATAAAASEGITVVVQSGWRSPARQRQLLQEAVAKYGSEREAARWVATPETSAHVSGDAVDVGPAEAIAWLSKHGRAFGLCPVYRNEPWHYELRPDAMRRGCPPTYADPTHDPRMQR